jgi:hypothetical protein
MPQITVTTLYGYKNKKPLVQIELPRSARATPKGRPMVQLSIDEARDLAMNIMQGAESAIQDAFIVEFFGEILEDERKAAAILNDFRQRRADRQDDPTA